MKSTLRLWALAAACALPIGPALAQTANDMPVARSEGPSQPRQNVTLPNGRIVHTTTNGVTNKRVIQVPGTPTLVVTWDEVLADGSLVHMSAVSLDGQAPLGDAHRSDHILRVRYQNFDPTRGQPATAPSLTAGVNNQLFMVQYHSTPLDVYKAQVEGLGASYQRFMADDGFIVRMDAQTAAQVAGLPYVRAVVPFHPAYKIAPDTLREVLTGAPDAGERLYSMEVFERGLAQQDVIAKAIQAMGGTVKMTSPDGFRMEAYLTPAQVAAVARLNELHYIDPWCGPAEMDMNIVRDLGGANFIETTLGFTGEGVRAEVFDSELRTTHQEFSLITPVAHSTAFTPGDAHGTSVFSITFARGATSTARGLLPDSQEQYFYRGGESTQFGGTHKSRLQIAQDLASGTFACVYQTSSLGSTRNLVYSTISQEMDDLLFQTGVLHTQSQSNAGGTAEPRDSRPQAWAKNIVSVGAVNHFNTTTRTDDTWLDGTGTSVGPAEDGRIKPDLCFFYDDTHAASNSSNTSYTQFGGTSGATPSVGGYFGLFHQMWHEGVWAGRGGGSTVFNSRPKMTTAKAALIASAFRYTWGAGGPNDDITRYVQGFGMPNLQTIYNQRNKTIIDNEESVLTQGGRKQYRVKVNSGESALNVVMCYMDPPGTTSSSQHRINDLSLKVTDPTGAVVRWGNNGLTTGNFNTTGGAANTKDTVECVFVQNPTPGVWTVEVIASQITQDARTETPAVDADFGLWATGGTLDSAEECLVTAVANNGRTEANAGVFMNLTAASHDLLITRIVCESSTAAGAMTAEIRTRPGTYVGFDGSATGWTLIGSYPGNSDGTQFTLDLSTNPLRVRAGETTGVYLVNTTAGGVRYTGTGGAVQDTWTDGELTLFSNLAKAAPIFTGANFTPRVFAGTICYEIDYGATKTLCTDLGLPAFSSTFSASTTRGYWFVAPTDFTICELQVPDESAHGLQNVEVVRLNANPPSFPTVTNSFTSLFRSIGSASSGTLSTQIRVREGDVIGILGACGDATTMRNSYAAPGAYPSSIFGLPVTLTRMGMQFNLASNTARDLWTEPAGNVSRVRMGYRASPWASRDLEVPAFNNNYANTSQTRGFYFTAPTDMHITGLRNYFDVAGPQNIEVVRFANGAPPAFSAVTNDFTSLFRAVGVNNTSIMQCNIAISAGDVIGILGATGTTTMNNSYAPAGPFNTTIAGAPVTLRRMGMQFNLNSTNARDIWSENSGQISRVQVFYKTRDSNDVLCLDADTAATGSNLVTTPLNTSFGLVSFTGEFLANGGGDPEFLDAGAFGNCFDFAGSAPTNAVLRFAFPVRSVTFPYGGNLGGIVVEALDENGVVIDSFTQADTNTNQPAGPQILFSATDSIRRIRWTDTDAGSSFAGLDNICVLVGQESCYADCDQSTGPGVLDIFDFLCFQNRYANAEPYACNCDTSTGNNVCDIFDFLCFQNAFANGCP